MVLIAQGSVIDNFTNKAEQDEREEWVLGFCGRLLFNFDPPTDDLSSIDNSKFDWMVFSLPSILLLYFDNPSTSRFKSVHLVLNKKEFLISLTSQQIVILDFGNGNILTKHFTVSCCGMPYSATKWLDNRLPCRLACSWETATVLVTPPRSEAPPSN